LRLAQKTGSPGIPCGSGLAREGGMPAAKNASRTIASSGKPAPTGDLHRLIVLITIVNRFFDVFFSSAALHSPRPNMQMIPIGLGSIDH
jgi:hypothetical protein